MLSSRLASALLVVLIALGLAACDDTVDGIQDDAETIESEVEEGIEDATDE
ncbi:hypothetical protein [Euzebya tangerina]|uniref:hypothetical protein n=1 Tax=Euzebya tangerina TaxID=591198 RepID=UPI0013C2EE4D|nr:hypothetical protein [Euzebya tangerina]